MPDSPTLKFNGEPSPTRRAPAGDALRANRRKTRVSALPCAKSCDECGGLTKGGQS